MQSIVFFPKRFGRTVDVDASPGESHDFLRLGFSKYIHFSSPLTIRCRKLFLSYRKSKISEVALRFFICLSVNLCGTHFLPFEFFPWHVNVWKYLGESCLMPPQVDLVFAYHLHPITLANRRPQLFLVFRSAPCRNRTSEAFKPTSQVVFDGACLP